MANYRNLLAWQKAHELALEIYKLSTDLPQEEKYGIRAQLRRAALSVPTNIVEGYNRKGVKEFAHFLDIALGSLAETEYLLEFSVDIGFLQKEAIIKIQTLLEETGRLLWELQQSKRRE